MTDDIVERLRSRTDPSMVLTSYPPKPAPDRLCHDAAYEIEQLRTALSSEKRITAHLLSQAEQRDDEIERLRAALLEIFDHECRTSDRSFIACTARDALWPRAALAGEASDDAAT